MVFFFLRTCEFCSLSLRKEHKEQRTQKHRGEKMATETKDAQNYQVKFASAAAAANEWRLYQDLMREDEQNFLVEITKTSDHGGDTICYERMWCTLESIADKLPELSAAHRMRLALDVCSSVVQLHRRDYVHGALGSTNYWLKSFPFDPKSRNAVLKLRGLQQQQQDNKEQKQTTKQDDVRALGQIVFEIITGRKISSFSQQDQDAIWSQAVGAVNKRPAGAYLFSQCCNEDLQLDVMCSQSDKPQYHKDALHMQQSAQVAFQTASCRWFQEIANAPMVIRKGNPLARVSTTQQPNDGDHDIFAGTIFVAGGASEQVRIKEFYPAAVMEYLRERDTTARILSKHRMNEFYIQTYGYSDKQRWIVYQLMNGSLDQVYTDQANSKMQLFSDVAKAWILYDVARIIYYLHRATPDEDATSCMLGPKEYGNSCALHRDIKSANLFLPRGWEEKVKTEIPQMAKEAKSLDEFLERLPALVRLGDGGCIMSISCSMSGNCKMGDKLYHPPETGDIEDNKKYPDQYSPDYDVWRFGLVAFEVCCGIDWHQGTSKDVCRIARHRLKPEAESPLQTKYTQLWMNNNEIDVPAVIYEIVQVGCFQTDPSKRPLPELLCRVTKRLLQDTLRMALNAPSLATEPSIVCRGGGPEGFIDDQLAKMGWPQPTPPAVPTKKTGCACFPKPKS